MNKFILPFIITYKLIFIHIFSILTFFVISAVGYEAVLGILDSPPIIFP